MLWTDADSRDFIAKEYPWFLDTFDAYTYPIQRADAIRYFVLYHYGGVYLDLDVGCRRRLDRLLVNPVILPRTIPVGVSNDLMFSEKGHPFMAQTIHNLVTFDHSWILNYPTVMFSTGPMFLSAQYGIWTSSHPLTDEVPGGEVRILPKSLYGKNAKIEDVPESFFTHFYGSSWHADDAAFIGFLGKWGKGLMWLGLVLFTAGLINLFWRRKSKVSERGRAGYQVLLPTGLGFFALNSRSITPTSSCPSSPSSDEENVPMLPLPLDVRPASPEVPFERRTGIVGALSRASQRVMATFSSRETNRGRSISRRSRANRGGILFFLPAILQPNNFSPTTVGAESGRGSRRPSYSRSSSTGSTTILSRSSRQPVEKAGYGYDEEFEDAHMYSSSSGLQAPVEGCSRPPTPGTLGGAPPPYSSGSTGDASAAARRGRMLDNGVWEQWESR